MTERPGGPGGAGGALRLRSGLAGLKGKVDGGTKMNGMRPLASPNWRLNKPEAAGACALAGKRDAEKLLEHGLQSKVLMIQSFFLLKRSAPRT